jgi:hypothetical protein
MSTILLKKSSVSFRTDNKIAILKEPILSNAVSSFSFILTLAEFLNSSKAVIPPNLVVPAQEVKTDSSENGKV